MTREEINLLTSTDLRYIASIPIDELGNTWNKMIYSHVFLYKLSLIRVEMQNTKINHVFVTDSNMKTKYMFSNSKAGYSYTFEEDCSRQNIDEIKDFLFEISLLIKHTPLSLDYDGKRINKFFKTIVRKEKIRKLLEESNNKI